MPRIDHLHAIGGSTGWKVLVLDKENTAEKARSGLFGGRHGAVDCNPSTASIQLLERQHSEFDLSISNERPIRIEDRRGGQGEHIRW